MWVRAWIVYSRPTSAFFRFDRAMVNSTHCRRAKRTTAGATLLLLAIVVVAPSSASAGCSHDVVSRSERSFQRIFSDLRLFVPSSEALSGPAPAVPRRDLPCSGPACSQGSRVPSVPASVSSARYLEWCCTTAVCTPCGPHLIDDLPETSPCRPLHRAEAPVRPPRALA